MANDEDIKLGIDFSDLVSTWEKIEEKYKRRDPYWNCILNEPDLMIDVSRNRDKLRVSWFKDYHFKDERIFSIKEKESDE